MKKYMLPRTGFAAVLGLLLLGQPSVKADLFVLSTSEPAGHGEVFRLDERSGKVLNRWTVGTESVHGIAVSLLGDVYVAGDTLGMGEMVRFKATGEQLGGFSSKEFTAPAAMARGLDGNLYSLSALPTGAGTFGQVVRFDHSGKFMNVFVPARNDTGRQFVDLAFRGEDSLFVVDYKRGVLRFDGQSGEFKGVFVPTGDDLVTPTGIAVGLDGNLYVSSRDANVVIKFDGKNGSYLDTFVSPGSQALNGPMGLAFGSDGNLYVTSCYDNRLVRFNGKTGDFAGVVASEDQGLHFPTRVTTGSVPFLMAAPHHP
ncbi:MAG: exported protein of unknown function [Verrucomicrobiales bacterium]|nr:exported protein of unknown function [Verrucomicrobiales bacterium]